LLTGVAVPIPSGPVPGQPGRVTAGNQTAEGTALPVAATDRRERLVELATELSGRIEELLKRQPQGPPRVLAIDPRVPGWLNEADALFSAGGATDGR